MAHVVLYVGSAAELAESKAQTEAALGPDDTMEIHIGLPPSGGAPTAFQERKLPIGAKTRNRS